MQRLGRLFLQHRRRLARLVLFAGLIVVGRQLWPTWPHETELEFVLGPDHADVVELRIAYLDHGEELHGVRFGFPSGAPATVRHRLSLPPGRLLIHCELFGKNGASRQLTRKLTAPANGLVRIALGPDREQGGPT